MTGHVVNSIRNILAMTSPDALFECDEARMINVKIDTVERCNSFVYLEEPTAGYYDVPLRGHQRQRTLLRLCFCKFEPMHNDAYRGDTRWSEHDPRPISKRIEIRDTIERDMVRPFIVALRASEFGRRYPDLLQTIRVLYPRARFDANEVSVCLEFTFAEFVCFNAPEPAGCTRLITETGLQIIAEDGTPLIIEKCGHIPLTGSRVVTEDGALTLTDSGWIIESGK